MNKREFRKLVRRINQDERALEKLYNYYFGKLVLFLTSKYGHELAEDAAQEFFIALIANPFYAYDVECPNTWVYTCCENIAKNKVAVEAKYQLVPDELFPGELEPDELSDKVVFPMDVEYIDLYNSLNELTEDEKELIYKIYWQGYLQEDIAKDMGMKACTIRQRHARILKKLK